MPKASKTPRRAAHALEKLFTQACLELRAQEKPNICAYAAEHHLPYDTLCRRYLSISKPAYRAHEQQQFLNARTESILVEWLAHLSDTGHPITIRTIRIKVAALCGKKPCRGWIPAFLRRNPDIKLSKSSGLDPRRAQAVNREVVGRHFDHFKKIIKDHAIPPENIYNMDEKGCQRGGGRKKSARKYFIPRHRRPAYKIRSANLELITIIECVSANGCGLMPGFVFSGVEQCPEWWDVDPRIW